MYPQKFGGGMSAQRFSSVISIWLLSLAVVSLEARDVEQYVQGEILVCFVAGATPEEIANFEQQFGLSRIQAFAHIRVFHYKLPETLSVEDAVQQLSQHALVEYAEPNYTGALQGVPSDPGRRKRPATPAARTNQDTAQGRQENSSPNRRPVVGS